MPVDDIVIKSIVFTVVGVVPPANNPLVDEEQAAAAVLVKEISPKSNAFPADAIVI